MNWRIFKLKKGFVIALMIIFMIALYFTILSKYCVSYEDGPDMSQTCRSTYNFSLPLTIVYAVFYGSIDILFLVFNISSLHRVTNLIVGTIIWYIIFSLIQLLIIEPPAA